MPSLCTFSHHMSKHTIIVLDKPTSANMLISYDCRCNFETEMTFAFHLKSARLKIHNATCFINFFNKQTEQVVLDSLRLK